MSGATTMEVCGLTLTQEGPHHDRTKWGDGPWWREPLDLATWEQEGIRGLIVRNYAGAWCGEVIVPPGHPWHGHHPSGCDGAPLLELPQKVDPGVNVAWLLSEPPGWWMIGWDHDHSWEQSPAGYDSGGHHHYATIEEVVDEVQRLMAYAAEVTT